MARSQHGEPVVLAIDQGTTNTKAVLVDASGRIRASGSTPLGVQTPRPGWVEQDPLRIWQSVLDAVTACLDGSDDHVVGLALSTQRETVVGWQRRSRVPIGPAVGWQDQRTSTWCAERLDAAADDVVRARTGLRIDPMFSAPKMAWLLEHTAAGSNPNAVALGTVDAWLVANLTGGAEHLCEAGNASRTLLYDINSLAWSEQLADLFAVPPSALAQVRRSDAGFGHTSGVPGLPDGLPVLAILADSHAALLGQGCTHPGSAKATYGTGTSVMAPVHRFEDPSSSVPTTLAWLSDRPTYAREGNIVSSGAALAWTAALLGIDVGELVELAASVPDSEGVTLLPAFNGLGAPHWKRDLQAGLTGMTAGTTRAHVARAVVDAVVNQVCDVVEVVTGEGVRIDALRADGGASVSALVMQTQADLLGLPVEVAAVAEVSALGVAQLGWQALDPGVEDWAAQRAPRRRFEPQMSSDERGDRRAAWRTALLSAGAGVGGR